MGISRNPEHPDFWKPGMPTPSWAGSMIGNYRSSQNLPPEATDEMIFIMLELTSGMNPEDIEESVGELRTEEGRESMRQEAAEWAAGSL